jgi:tRNA(Ile)-lysidine synthase
MLHLAARWGRATGTRLAVATVDHGLRAEAAAEAAGVAAAAAALGLPHDTLAWRGWSGRGNLQDAARQARRRLLADWARARGLARVALAHTADDQAETVLLRLARGSGVDGLAGMAEEAGLFLRPLLGVGREELRAWARAQGLAWVEDPSNADPRYDRVRARAALATLAPLGLTVARLTATAAHMARARAALEAAVAALACAEVTEEGGGLTLSAGLIARPMGEVEGRLFAAALRWIGGGAYRPRHAALARAWGALAAGGAATLAGVAMRAGPRGATLAREPAAVAPPVPCDGAPVTWDGRWQVTPPPGAGPLRVGALGEGGLARLPGWRATGLSRALLVPSPALWQGDRLISAPLAGFAAGGTAQAAPPFALFLLSH